MKKLYYLTADLIEANSRAISRAAQAWEGEEGDLLALDEFRGAVENYLRLPELLADLCRVVWEHTKPEQYVATGQIVSQCFEAVATAAEALRRIGAKMQDAGFLVVGLEKLSTAATDVEALRSQFFAEWPPREDEAMQLASLHRIAPERLKQIAAHNKPPQSWYEEADKPF